MVPRDPFITWEIPWNVEKSYEIPSTVVTKYVDQPLFSSDEEPGPSIVWSTVRHNRNEMPAATIQKWCNLHAEEYILSRKKFKLIIGSI